LRIAGRFLPQWGLLALGCIAQATGLAESLQPVDTQLGDSITATEGSLSHPSMLATPTTLDHVGRVLLPVMINGRGPFHFVVDTGASSSTLSPAVARALGLQPTATVEVNGITGVARVPAVKVSRLVAGDMVLADKELPVVWAPLMAGADGILGLAGFDVPNLFVDFERNTVQLTHGTLMRSVSAQVLRLHASQVRGGLLTFEARVGRVRVRAILDTGAERTLGNLALRDALNARSGIGKLVTTKVYGATDEVVNGEIQEAPTIAIDSLRIADTQVVYGDFHVFGVWGMQEQPALIVGMDVLGRVASLGVDFNRRNVLITSLNGGGGLGTSSAAAGTSARH
jgi:predicted aspartyl protease